MKRMWATTTPEFDNLLRAYKMWAEANYDMHGDHVNMQRPRMQFTWRRRLEAEERRKAEKEKKHEAAADARDEEARQDELMQEELDKRNPNQGVWADDDRRPHSDDGRRARSRSPSPSRRSRSLSSTSDSRMPSPIATARARSQSPRSVSEHPSAFACESGTEEETREGDPQRDEESTVPPRVYASMPWGSPAAPHTNPAPMEEDSRGPPPQPQLMEC